MFTTHRSTCILWAQNWWSLKLVEKNAFNCLIKFSHFHDNIIAKTVNSMAVFFCLVEINSKIWDVTIFGIGSHPNFYTVFSQLSWHELSKGKVAFVCNHSFIDWHRFWRPLNVLYIAQNHVHNSVNFEQAVVIIISALWFVRWMTEMHVLQVPWPFGFTTCGRLIAFTVFRLTFTAFLLQKFLHFGVRYWLVNACS